MHALPFLSRDRDGKSTALSEKDRPLSLRITRATICRPAAICWRPAYPALPSVFVSSFESPPMATGFRRRIQRVRQSICAPPMGAGDDLDLTSDPKPIQSESNWLAVAVNFLCRKLSRSTQVDESVPWHVATEPEHRAVCGARSRAGSARRSAPLTERGKQRRSWLGRGNTT